MLLLLSRRPLLLLAAFLAALAAPGCATVRPAAVRTVNVADHGALLDGRTNDAAALQRAIDTCAAAGGGRVLLPAGRTALSGTIELRSNVTLHLERGATLLASADRAHYRDDTLIRAHAAHDIALTGPGTIAGQARRFMAADLGPIYRAQPWRPALVLWTACADVTLHDVTFDDAPQWTVHLAGCDRVDIARVTIANDMRIPNNDGLDIDRCRRVRIRDCTISAGDDCIVLKSTRKYADLGACEDVEVSGCTLASTSAALKVGTETVGDIRRVTFRACTVRPSHRGLAIMLRDEGTVEEITFADITVETRQFDPVWWGRAEPIHVTALPRTAATKLGVARNIRFRNITCRGENGAVLVGAAGGALRDVTLEDVRLHVSKTTEFPAGAQDRRPTTPPDQPAHATAGVFAERVAGLVLRRCAVTWGTAGPLKFGKALELVDCPAPVVEAFAEEKRD